MVLGRITTAADAARHPAWYLSRTGFLPLYTGVGLLIMGASDLALRLYPRSIAVGGGLPFLAMPCWIAAALWGWRVLRRRALTIGGFVEPPGSWWPAPAGEKSAWWPFVPVAAFPVAIALFLLMIPGHAPSVAHGLIEPGYTICVALAVLLEGYRRKGPLLIVFAAYLLCLARLQWSLRDTPNLLVLTIGAGAPVAIAGAIRLRSVLKANPPTPSPATPSRC